jgi:hypothetical protein
VLFVDPIALHVVPLSKEISQLIVNGLKKRTIEGAKTCEPNVAGYIKLCVVVADAATITFLAEKFIPSEAVPRTKTESGTLTHVIVKAPATVGAFPLTYATGLCVVLVACHCGAE